MSMDRVHFDQITIKTNASLRKRRISSKFNIQSDLNWVLTSIMVNIHPIKKWWVSDHGFSSKRRLSVAQACIWVADHLLGESDWALLNTNYFFCKLEIFAHERLNTGYTFSQTNIKYCIYWVI